MWFKYGLKAQKFLAQGNGCKQHALKGQKLLAQGIALGIYKAFALTGRQVCVHTHPGRCPGLRASALSGRVELTCEN